MDALDSVEQVVGYQSAVELLREHESVLHASSLGQPACWLPEGPQMIAFLLDRFPIFVLTGFEDGYVLCSYASSTNHYGWHISCICQVVFPYWCACL